MIIAQLEPSSLCPQSVGMFDVKIPRVFSRVVRENPRVKKREKVGKERTEREESMIVIHRVGRPALYINF